MVGSDWVGPGLAGKEVVGLGAWGLAVVRVELGWVALGLEAAVEGLEAVATEVLGMVEATAGWEDWVEACRTRGRYRPRVRARCRSRWEPRLRNKTD